MKRNLLKTVIVIFNVVLFTLFNYGEKLSNLFEDLKKLDDFAQYIIAS